MSEEVAPKAPRLYHALGRRRAAWNLGETEMKRIVVWVLGGMLFTACADEAGDDGDTDGGAGGAGGGAGGAGGGAGGAGGGAGGAGGGAGGAGGGAGGAGGGGELALEAYNQALASAVCGKLFECCPAGVPPFITDQPSCEALIAGFALESAQVGLDNMFLTYDAGNAGACIPALQQAFGAVDCADFNIDDPAALAGLDVCGRVLAGQQGNGAPCEVDQGMGTTVSSSEYCQDGLVCVAGTCQPPAANGQACDTFEANCAEGLYCSAATSTCAAPVGEGQPCDEDAACTTGSCPEGTCVVPDICALGEQG